MYCTATTAIDSCWSQGAFPQPYRYPTLRYVCLRDPKKMGLQVKKPDPMKWDCQ